GSRDFSFDSNGPGLETEVFSLLRLPDDKLLVGFMGDKLNATRLHGIGRLNADGTTDDAFHPPVFRSDTAIGAIARQADRKIIISGDLKIPSGDSYVPFRLLRLHEDGTLDTTFTPPSYVGGGPIAIQEDGEIIAATAPG